MIRALTTPDHPPRSTRAGRRFAFAAAAVVCASILALTACRLDPAQRTESPVQPGAASAARRLIAPVDEPSKPTELTEDAIDDPSASVVAVYAVRDGGGDSSDRPEGDTWLGDERRLPSASRCDHQPAQVAGSGVLIDARGLVLTAAHVVRAARSVRVSLSDGREVGAVRWAADPMTDLAVLRLETPDDARQQPDMAPCGSRGTADECHEVLTAGPPLAAPLGRGNPFDGVIRFGDAGSLVPGQTLRILGNSWNAAAAGRPVIAFGRVSVQDAARAATPAALTLYADVHPGSSGGPVLDASGRLVGIVSARAAPAGRPACAAVPMNERTRTAIDRLILDALE